MADSHPTSRESDASLEQSLEGWQIYQLALLDDPHPEWARLRERAPVLDVGGGLTFVTSWAAVDSALRNTELQAGRGVSESFADSSERVQAITRAWLMSLDGPAHTRARSLVRRQFGPRSVESMRASVVSLADDLVVRLVQRAQSEPVDLVEHLGFALPSQVTRWLFRLPEREWRERVESAVRADASGTDSPEVGASLDRVAAYFEEALASERRLDPESLFERLRSAVPEPGEEGGPRALDDAEIVANSVLLVSAAMDTTMALIANSVLCLLQHPEQWSMLRERPGRVALAVEETLRFESPALSCSRHVPAAFELEGVPIEAGTQLLLGLAAANRDPARYDDPDRFDITRRDVHPLTFGGGRHFCLGAALARLEAQAALASLLRHAPELQLVEPPEWRKDNPTLRCPRALWVRASTQSSQPRGGP